MKLLLDEMFPGAIAAALVERGHDVVAVSADRALRSLDDASIFEHALRGRAVVTEDVDYVRLDAIWRTEGRSHFGVVLTSVTSFPRHRAGFIGDLTRALESFLDDHRGDERASAIWWLQPVN